MYVVPAVLLGGFVLWFLLFMVASSIFTLVSERRQRGQIKKQDPFTDNDAEFVAVITAIITVVLVLVALFVLPKDWATGLWVALTVVGIIFGAVTLIVAQGARQG